jgi:hypothetical protein
MNQSIVIDYPPLYDEIDAMFHVRKLRGVIFSFGPVVYNPSGITIAPEFIAHELVHGQRQGASEPAILDWWRRYLYEPRFRLAEEIPAHVAEYRWLLENGNRDTRRAAASTVAARLAAPIYGRMVGRSAALDMLRSACA